MASYSLMKNPTGWAVMDETGRFYGSQATKAGGLLLLKIMQHMEEARQAQHGRTEAS